MNTQSPDTIIFLHVPKTAGTTLNQVMQRQYEPSQTYFMRADTQDPIRDYNAFSPERKAQTRLVAGHFAYGFHKHVPGTFNYFTILRNPIDRVVSFYYFVRRNGQHYLHDTVINRNQGIQEFVESGITPIIDNGHTRLISGVMLAPAFGTCTTEMLEQAKQNLCQSFRVVGLMEHFDESLLLLKNAYGWQDIYYTRQNVTRERPMTTALSAEELAAVTAVNHLDIALYEFAQTLFNEQIAAQGPKFARQVKAYQLFNKWHGRIGRHRIERLQRARHFPVRAAIRNWLSHSNDSLE